MPEKAIESSTSMKKIISQNAVVTPLKDRLIQRFSTLASALAAIAILATPQAKAASASWNVDANGSWVTDSNWNPASAPGVGDTATFGLSLGADRTVTVDNGRNIQNITFSSTSAFKYTLTGGTLSLGNGGVILESGASGTHTDQINTNTTIQGDGGSASFTNNGASTLRFFMNGSISGVSTNGNVTTLNLDGTQTGGQSSKIVGIISDGGSGGKLAVVKDGSATWNLVGANTFSGGVTLKAGVLGLEGNINTVLGAGTLTINGGTISSASTTADVTYANAIVVGGNFTFTDATATTNAVTFSGAMDLGGTTRTISTTSANSNSLNFSGVISNGGLIKAGISTSTLTLSGANTYVGDTTVTSGTLILADNSQTKFLVGTTGVNNQINGNGPLTLDGDFVFDLSGAGTTLGDSWDIVHVASLAETFGATFSVLGFTDNLDNTWSKLNGGITYTFAESTGLLSVTAIPEPVTWALLAFGMTTVMVLRRRRA